MKQNIPKPLTIFDKIQNQLEFYLGNANFSKDKFLQKLAFTNKRNSIDLKVFLKFNKIMEILKEVMTESE